jgi:hypothetical protein
MDTNMQVKNWEVVSKSQFIGEHTNFIIALTLGNYMCFTNAMFELVEIRITCFWGHRLITGLMPLAKAEPQLCLN